MILHQFLRWFKKLYYETYPEERKIVSWAENDPKLRRKKGEKEPEPFSDEE